jgi:hypothetical protein
MINLSKKSIVDSKTMAGPLCITGIWVLKKFPCHVQNIAIVHEKIPTASHTHGLMEEEKNGTLFAH